MKQIDKTLLFNLKTTFDCSEEEFIKTLVVFKCKKKYTDYNLKKIQKDEFYYVIVNYPFYTVLTKNSLMSFSIDNAINFEYFYDYFMTEKEVRNEKLKKIHQVSSNLQQ